MKFLAAFLYLNEKPKPAIREKTQSQSTSGLTLNGTLCDYEIICEEKKFSCHKSVLASNSSVFKVNNYSRVPNITGVEFQKKCRRVFFLK